VLTGAHVIVYSKDSAADRDFFRDVLKYPFVDVDRRQAEDRDEEEGTLLTQAAEKEGLEASRALKLGRLSAL